MGRSFAGEFGRASLGMAVDAEYSLVGREYCEGTEMCQDCPDRIVGSCNRDSHRSWVGAGLSCVAGPSKKRTGLRIADEAVGRLLGERDQSSLLLHSSYDLHWCSRNHCFGSGDHR